MHTWQMQDAKARLSELVKCAQTDGPQAITLHGRSVAFVVSCEVYERLTGNGQSLLEFMQRSPLHDHEELEFERDSSATRGISF